MVLSVIESLHALFGNMNLIQIVIFMNCPDERLYLPREEHKILKIHVTDDKMFEKCANKLKDKTHLHISVIGANWIPSNDDNCLAECEVVSVGKQICKGD